VAVERGGEVVGAIGLPDRATAERLSRALAAALRIS
jgi:hypothetical protein